MMYFFYFLSPAQPDVSTPAVAPLVGLSVEVLAICNAADGHPPAEIKWNFGFLHNISTVNNSTENADGTTSVTSYLMGVPSRDIHQSTVKCIVRHPTLNQDEIVNYSLDIQCK